MESYNIWSFVSGFFHLDNVFKFHKNTFSAFNQKCIKQTITYRIDKQQGPIVLYPVINIMEKNMKKNIYIYMYNWITVVQQKLTQHCESSIRQ